ncbi:unnamed protein product [Pocillopora meandrina]|uniref:POU domain protein n=1 Tax=Pocillopora meandrina TaxID=46732 RepID=A0AAU9WSY1_9CNID|nr:unnamed protein product [Pocillopora meandrina]
MADWVEYFSRHTPPGNLKEVRASVCEFAGKHRAAGKEIVFVTSGGTRVPLEENAVRFLDNFSMGTRGSASAEYFLEQGYAVVFLHRQGSLRPFTRHFPTEDVLDLLQLKDMPDGSTQVQVNASKVPKLTQVLKIYRQVQTAGTLLLIEYNSLSEYLFLLRTVAESLAPHGPAVMMYLAAAVSDFYIPPQDLPKHKIQSNAPLQLNLVQSPKMMAPLVKEWIPQAFTVSFKLETDMNIISKKAREALAKYSHQVVVSNILQTRKKTVVMITPTQETAIWMSDSELEAGREIEEKIVADLKKMHQHFYTSVVMQGNTRSVIGSEQLCQNTNQSIQSSMQVGHFVTSQIQALPVSQNGGVISGYSTYTIPTSSLTLPAPVVTQIQVVKAQEPPPSQEVSQTSVEDLSDSPNSSAQIFGTLSDSCLTADMKAFIESFRARRIALGYTQEDVGNELSHSNGHSSYSQSFISRFESKNLGLKAAEKMKPVLQGWIEQKEQECAKGLRMCKKRKRRTSFSNETLQYLIHAFEQNPKPSSAEIIEISSKLGLEPVTVRVWFCNRKQMMKRMASGKGRPNLSLKAELDAKKQEDQSIEKEPTKLDFTNMPVGQFSFTEDRVKALVCLTSEGSPVKSSRPTVSTTDVSFAQVHDNSIVHSVSGTRNTVPENTQLIEPALISNGVATYETVSNVPLTESQS